MALRDISNTYIPSVRLSSRYAPVIKRGVVLDDQSSRVSFPTRRANGETHIDLWVDGGLYPMDPATNSPPRFSTTKEYLEFLCHGEQGMLGYTKYLSSAATRLQSMVRGYEEDIHYLQQQYEVHRGAVESLSNTTTELVQEHVRLQTEVGNLEATCEALRMSYATAAETSRGTILSLETKLARSRASCEELQAKIKYMVETPRGLHKCVHTLSMKNVDELAPSS